ncbi:dihydrofolate reductase family protein [Staphylococcus saprophyticus]|uniref:dihydrofolate reductase family protein n=1 Tax=Staphylococcus saprophyticus TaxID=29385 RepID=UPI00289B9E3F|nr:dihydrofolate reductase family protein [Staphylococcus saprophyticus]
MNNNSKIILDLAVTLDGFIEGPNGEIDWCIMEPEMNFTAFLNQIDAIIYGRKSYDLWGLYTPDDEQENDDQLMWQLIHSKNKYVFTNQTRSNHDQTQFIKPKDMYTTVNDIKSQQQKDIWLYGGSELITSFIKHDLIDEYRLSIHPVVLGTGKPLFENIHKQLNLSHVQTNTFKSGVVQLIYSKA